MRIAAIDIGTNSIHMIVVQVRPDLSFEVVDREKEMVRLGAGGLDGRSLTPTATTAALQTLAKFRRLADSHKVDEIVAAATSAIREADNGGDFIAEVARRTGIKIRVISGTEEARLIHLAAVYGVHMGGSPAVVIDIGGGSIEVTLGTASHLSHARSFKLGVIRLTERFVRTDPLAPRDERRLVKHINKEIGGYLDTIADKRFDRVIGTSGTILSLGALALSEDGVVRDEALRNRRVSAKAIHRLRKRLSGADLEARLHMDGLDPRRADIAVAGSVLLDSVLRRLGADDITLCDLALREGLVLDYIHRNTATIRKIERYPDVRRRSIVELGERCGYSAAHARHVSQLALSVFDQTRAVHKLADREREWLEYGALLHDAGVHISYERHHRHSYYLIKNGELRGFDPQEIEIIALLARYHRQATPKKSHDGYGSLKGGLRRTVRTLAAMLRLAEGLDRSHAQVVTALDVVPRGDAYLIRLRAAGDAELELWAAHRHGAELGAGAPPPAAVRGVGPPSTSARAGTRRNAHHMLNNLTTPHEYPGKLFVVEGIDGSGKTTQLALLAKWLSAAGHPVFQTEWNSSALVKAATKTGKKKNALTPMTFSLLHATDFADRLLYNVIPPLKAGHDRARRSLHLHRLRARRRARRRSPLGARALQLRGEAGPRRLLPRADRRLGRSPDGAAREAQVLRSGHGHGLERQRARELPHLPGQGARRIRSPGRRVRPERRQRRRQHHRPAARVPAARVAATGNEDTRTRSSMNLPEERRTERTAAASRASTTATASRTCRSATTPAS